MKKEYHGKAIYQAFRVKLPNMENGLVIFILAVQIGATIVFAQQLYGQVCGVLQ